MRTPCEVSLSAAASSRKSNPIPGGNRWSLLIIVVSGPGDFYIQDDSGGIAISIPRALRLDRGDALGGGVLGLAIAMGAVRALHTAAPDELPRLAEVTIDRPFIFAIVDETTGATLFLGRVLDPSA